MPPARTAAASARLYQGTRLPGNASLRQGFGIGDLGLGIWDLGFGIGESSGMSNDCGRCGRQADRAAISARAEPFHVKQPNCVYYLFHVKHTFSRTRATCVDVFHVKRRRIAAAG